MKGFGDFNLGVNTDYYKSPDAPTSPTVDMQPNASGIYEAAGNSGNDQSWYQPLLNGFGLFGGNLLKSTAEQLYGKAGNPAGVGAHTGANDFWAKNKYWFIGGGLVIVGVIAAVKLSKKSK